jgi:hypothetical protein
MLTHPTVFISYSWDDEAHKHWVRQLATQLRTDGVDVHLDHWHAVPGDQLPEFMEREIRDNDYVLIICTPKYKDRSDKRIAGVGYEGDIMTGEVFTKQNHRKFIPVLARGPWTEASPSWLVGRRYIDLSDAARYTAGYSELKKTILGIRDQPPPLGRLPQEYTPPSRSQPAERVRSKSQSVNLELFDRLDGTTFPRESQFNWVPKHGAYILALIRKAQEFVQDKLVTINGFLRTLIIKRSCKIEPSRAINC